MSESKQRGVPEEHWPDVDDILTHKFRLTQERRRQLKMMKEAGELIDKDTDITVKNCLTHKATRPNELVATGHEDARMTEEYAWWRVHHPKHDAVPLHKKYTRIKRKGHPVHFEWTEYRKLAVEDEVEDFLALEDMEDDEDDTDVLMAGEDRDMNKDANWKPVQEHEDSLSIIKVWYNHDQMPWDEESVRAGFDWSPPKERTEAQRVADAGQFWRNKAMIREMMLQMLDNEGMLSAQIISGNFLAENAPYVIQRWCRGDRRRDGVVWSLYVNRCSLGPPVHYDTRGFLELSGPNHCRAQHIGYGHGMWWDTVLVSRSAEDGSLLHVVFEDNIFVGCVPAMVGTAYCVNNLLCGPSHFSRQDPGGTFITENGSDRMTLMELVTQQGRWFMFRSKTQRHSFKAEIRPMEWSRHRSPSTLYIKKLRRFPRMCVVAPFCDDVEIPLGAFFRLLGVHNRRRQVNMIASWGETFGWEDVLELDEDDPYREGYDAINSLLAGEIGFDGYKTKVKGQLKMPDFDTMTLDQVVDFVMRMINSQKLNTSWKRHSALWVNIVKDVLPHISTMPYRGALRVKALSLAHAVRVQMQIAIEDKKIEAGAPRSARTVFVDESNDLATKRMSAPHDKWLTVINRTLDASMKNVMKILERKTAKIRKKTEARIMRENIARKKEEEAAAIKMQEEEKEKGAVSEAEERPVGNKRKKKTSSKKGGRKKAKKTEEKKEEKEKEKEKEEIVYQLPIDAIKSIRVADCFGRDGVSITEIMQKAVNSGDLSAKKKQGAHTDTNATRGVNVRAGPLGLLNDITSTTTPTPKKNPLMMLRELHGSSTAFIDPFNTPESHLTGINTNWSSGATSYPGVKPSILWRQIKAHAPDLIDAILPLTLWTNSLKPAPDDQGGWNAKRERLHDKMVLALRSRDTVTVHINGVPVGVLMRGAKAAVKRLKFMRRRNMLNSLAAVYLDEGRRELHVQAPKGMLRTNLIVLEEHGFVGTMERIRDIFKRHWRGKLRSSPWEEMFRRGLIEKIGPLEMKQCNVRPNPMEVPDITNPPDYTHMMIHPMQILNCITLLSPALHYNQGPRITFSTQLNKATLVRRMELLLRKSCSYVSKTEKDMVCTLVSNILNTTGGNGYGKNLWQAYMTLDGFNQEDGIVVDRQRMQLDPFFSGRLLMNMSSTLDQHVTKGKVLARHCVPPANALSGAAPEAYHALEADGLVRVGSTISGKDVVIGATIDVTRDRIPRNISTTAKRFHGIGKVTRAFKILKPKNKILAAVMVQTWWRTRIGDKITNRHAQKGIIAQYKNTEDMPFETTTGMRPDIIRNPLGYPSRMADGMMVEGIAGHLAVALGHDIEVNGLEEGNPGDPEELMRILREAKDLTDEEWNAAAKSVGLADLGKTISFVDRQMLDAKGAGEEDVDYNCDGRDDPDMSMEEARRRFKARKAIFKTLSRRTMIDNIQDSLRKAGQHYFTQTGEVEMINGITGEPISQRVTLFLEYTMQLLQKAARAIHARTTGPVNGFSRNGTQGKDNMGAIQVGSMEKDCLIAFGASHLCETITRKELFVVCTYCGLIARGNRNTTFTKVTQNKSDWAYCLRCRTHTHCRNVDLPYAFILFTKLMLPCFIATCLDVETNDDGTKDFANASAPGYHHPAPTQDEGYKHPLAKQFPIRSAQKTAPAPYTYDPSMLYQGAGTPPLPALGSETPPLPDTDLDMGPPPQLMDVLDKTRANLEATQKAGVVDASVSLPTREEATAWWDPAANPGHAMLEKMNALPTSHVPPGTQVEDMYERLRAAKTGMHNETVIPGAVEEYDVEMHDAADDEYGYGTSEMMGATTILPTEGEF